MQFFENLYIFEMANNHQGNLQHGMNIIKAMGDLSKRNDIKGAVKFQYRDLDTFIHEDFIAREDVKHIPRFIGTRLSDEEFRAMAQYVKENGMVSISTPFDEISVEKCLKNDIDIIKIASCSADDWPLLDEISKAGRPVIASTGGLSIYEIDNLVSFFQHRNVEFALMHCVALYPTPNSNIQMNFLEKMIKRYPEITVGYSGHEAPDNNDVVKIAVSKGARLLERHVGVETEDIKLNKYSMNPDEVEQWVKAAKLAQSICGDRGDKQVNEEEKSSLLSLKRGVYAIGNITKGEKIKKEDVFFAMPCEGGQLTSGEFGRYRSTFIASRDYKSNQGVFEKNEDNSIIDTIRGILHDAKGMMYEAGIRFGNDYSIEISHHYGIERFREFGALIVNIINREYCKKLVLLLPNQKHPNHYHKIKEETFQLLSGDVDVDIEGTVHSLKPGDTLLVERRMLHSFSSKNGGIFEEVSTTHVKGDSYYEDGNIASLDPMQRKTVIDEW